MRRAGAQGLQKWQTQTHASTFDAFAALSNLLLYKLSQNTDTCFGALQNNNAVPVVLTVEPTASFSDLQTQVSAAIGEAVAHELPFTRLVPSGAEKWPACPFFQFALRCLDPPAAKAAKAEQDLFLRVSDGSAVRPLSTISPVDFLLTVLTDGRGFATGASLAYASEVYDTETAQDFADRIVHSMNMLFVEGKTDAPVHSLDVILPKEREWLHKTNGEMLQIPQEHLVPVHGQMLRNAQQRPNDIAVVLDDRKLTYAQFAASALRLAEYLRNECGVGAAPDMVVLQCVDRCMEMPVGFFGILLAGDAPRCPRAMVFANAEARTGGGYCPLNPNDPGDRMRTLQEQTQARVVLTTTNIEYKLEPLAGKVRARRARAAAGRCCSVGLSRVFACSVAGDGGVHRPRAVPDRHCHALAGRRLPALAQDQPALAVLPHPHVGVHRHSQDRGAIAPRRVRQDRRIRRSQLVGAPQRPSAGA